MMIVNVKIRDLGNRFLSQEFTRLNGESIADLVRGMLSSGDENKRRTLWEIEKGNYIPVILEISEGNTVKHKKVNVYDKVRDVCCRDRTDILIMPSYSDIFN